MYAKMNALSGLIRSTVRDNIHFAERPFFYPMVIPMFCLDNHVRCVRVAHKEKNSLRLPDKHDAILHGLVAVASHLSGASMAAAVVDGLLFRSWKRGWSRGSTTFAEAVSGRRSSTGKLRTVALERIAPVVVLPMLTIRK